MNNASAHLSNKTSDVILLDAPSVVVIKLPSTMASSSAAVIHHTAISTSGFTVKYPVGFRPFNPSSGQNLGP